VTRRKLPRRRGLAAAVALLVTAPSGTGAAAAQPAKVVLVARRLAPVVARGLNAR